MLEKLFIKNYQDVNNPKVRTAYGVLCSVLGIISNIILSAAKMIIGVLSGSISIIADGIDNLSDCASSVATLVGFKLAAQPADPEHPFGHERIEYVTAIIISILILIIGVLLCQSSIENIINKTVLNIVNFYLLMGILIGSILVKLFQFLYYRRIAKKIKSASIKASSQDSFNDAIKTTVVLISMLIFKIWNLNLDGWFGLAVSIYIIINGIMLVKEASSPLIGEAPDKNFTKNVVDKLESYKGVLGIHDLVIHNYGPAKTFITVHAEVDSRDNILDIHDNMDNIERDFREELGIELTIHMDPIQIDDEVTNCLREATGKVIKEFDGILKFHDFRIVKGTTHINVLFDVVVPPKYKLSDEELRTEIVKRVKQECEKIENIEINVIINVNKDYVL